MVFNVRESFLRTGGVKLDKMALTERSLKIDALQLLKKMLGQELRKAEWRWIRMVRRRETIMSIVWFFQVMGSEEKKKKRGEERRRGGSWVLPVPALPVPLPSLAVSHGSASTWNSQQPKLQSCAKINFQDVQ